jgi:hypothetical protein
MYETERKWGPFALALAVAGGLVIGGIALSAVFWALGIVAHIVAALFRIGLLVLFAAGIVWAIRHLFRDRSAV